ncbi:DedA family protein [Candidatus Kaiserbacteria bacterium]|nr:DedA family protein [Candidatus Kaiserbacteria bacterium]
MSWHLIHEWHMRSWAWFVEHTHKPHALAWLGGLAFADALFFPLAPEIYLVAFALAQPARWRQYLPVAIVFSVLGAAVGYYVGGFLFQQFGEPLLALYGLQDAFARAQVFIQNGAFVGMAIASFTPIPDKVFIYAGGFLGAPFVPFIAGYTLGRALRMGLVVYLSIRYGRHALDIIKQYLAWFGVALVILGIIYAMVHWHLLPWF